MTPEIFNQMRNSTTVQRIFEELDIADDDQSKLFETLDVDGSGTVDLEELCSGISKLRGDACRSDIITINFMLQNMQSEMQGCMNSFVRRLHKQEEILDEIQAVLGSKR